MQLRLTAVAFLISAACTATAQTTYKTNSLCTTRYGTKSAAPKSTVTLTSTITPPPATTTTTTTTTSTVLETTTPTSTVTSTITSTETDTETDTVTATTGTVTTTTSTPPATTISASAGFTPAQQAPGYVPKKRSDVGALPAIRGRVAQPVEERARAVIKCPPIGGPKQFTPVLYPTTTICGTLVQAITTTTKSYTASTKATKTQPTSTITSTATSTSITTQTVAGDPTFTTTYATATETTTTTSTTTLTITTTDTQTVAAPTPTVYGQCQSDNLIGAANRNQGIYQPSYAGYTGVSINQVSISGPVQCCGTCQQAAGCVGYSQYPGGPCYYYTVDPSQCNGAATFDDYYQSAAFVAAGQGYIVGNGQCGQFRDGGSV